MTSKLVAIACLVAVAAFTSTLASAQQKPANAQEAKAAFAEKFKAADTNQDGKLSREEAEAGMPEVFKNYDKIDTKKTNAITQKQIGAYFAARAKQQRAARDPGSLN